MGQDREDRQGRDADLNPVQPGEPGPVPVPPYWRDPAVFRAEIARAVRYERGLLAKLAVALLIVALVAAARAVFFG